MNSEPLDPKVKRNLELYSRLREETQNLVAAADLAQKRKTIYSFVDPMEKNNRKDLFASSLQNPLQENTFFKTPVPAAPKRRYSKADTNDIRQYKDIHTSDEKLELSDLTNQRTEELHSHIDSLKEQESRIVDILSHRMQLLERMKTEQEEYDGQRTSVGMKDDDDVQATATSFPDGAADTTDSDENDSDSDVIADFIPVTPRQNTTGLDSSSLGNALATGFPMEPKSIPASNASENTPTTHPRSNPSKYMYAQDRSAANKAAESSSHPTNPSHWHTRTPHVQEVDSIEYPPTPHASTPSRVHAASHGNDKTYVDPPTSPKRPSSYVSNVAVNQSPPRSNLPTRKAPKAPNAPIPTASPPELPPLSPSSAPTTPFISPQRQFEGSLGPLGSDTPSNRTRLSSPSPPPVPRSPESRPAETHLLPTETIVKYSVYSPSQAPAPRATKLEERARKRAERERAARMAEQKQHAEIAHTPPPDRRAMPKEKKEDTTKFAGEVRMDNNEVFTKSTESVPTVTNATYTAENVQPESPDLSNATTDALPNTRNTPNTERTRRSSRSNRLFPPIRRNSNQSQQTTGMSATIPTDSNEESTAPKPTAPVLPVVLTPGIRTTSNHNIYGLLSAAQKHRYNMTQQLPASASTAGDSANATNTGLSVTSNGSVRGSASDAASTTTTTSRDSSIPGKSPGITPTEKPQLALVKSANDTSSDGDYNEDTDDIDVGLLGNTSTIVSSNHKYSSTVALDDGKIVDLHSTKVSDAKAVEAHKNLVSEPPRNMLDLLTSTETTINTNPLLQSQISRGLQGKLVPKAGEPEHLGQMARTVEGILKHGYKQQEQLVLQYEHQRIMEEEAKIAEAAWKAYKEGRLLRREKLLLETMEKLHSTPTEEEVRDPEFRAKIEKEMRKAGFRVKKDFQPLTREQLLETCKALAERIDRTMIFDEGDISGIIARNREELEKSRKILLKTKRFFEVLYANNRLAALPNLELQRSDYIKRVQKYDRVSNRLDAATVGLSDKAKLLYPDLVHANDMDFLQEQYLIPPVDSSEYPVLHASGIYVAQLQLRPGQHVSTPSGPLLWRPYWAVLTADALRFYKSNEDATLDTTSTIWYKRRRPLHYVPITPDRDVPLPKQNIRDAEKGINIIQQNVTVNLCRIEPPGFLPLVQYALVVTIVPTKVTPVIAADLPAHQHTTQVTVPPPTRWIMVFSTKNLLASWFGLLVGLLNADREEANKYLSSVPEF